MKLSAHAKINLYLHITGRRNDGYHLLESLMIPTALSDDIEIKPADTISLEVKGRFADAAGHGDNIVLKAAKLLFQDKNDLGAHITLTKNIPTGAGLGGGSADAAAVMRGLNDIWQLGYSIEELAELGLRLGADVPFCIYNKPAHVSGIGEIIKTVDIPKLPLILINPNLALPTKNVFEKYKISGKNFSRSGHKPDEYINAKNDLEESAICFEPKIGEILKLLNCQKNIQFARMSGSGATCFGVFESFAARDKAFENLKLNDDILVYIG